jgi:hypothetical protein
MHGGLRVGRIYRHPAATIPDQEWFWEINGVHARLNVLTISGNVGSLDEAKAELKANWQKWLAWAELSDP